jgi:hypothetical protein
MIVETSLITENTIIEITHHNDIRIVTYNSFNEKITIKISWGLIIGNWLYYLTNDLDNNIELSSIKYNGPKDNGNIIGFCENDNDYVIKKLNNAIKDFRIYGKGHTGDFKTRIMIALEQDKKYSDKLLLNTLVSSRVKNEARYCIIL